MSLAQAQPGWIFDGVDPAAEMLKLAGQTLGPLGTRVDLHEGYIEDAPEGPFDAATCLLTLHFLAPEDRRRTLGEIHRRLKPGAPFVAAHASFPQEEGERGRWLSRYAAFATASGMDPAKAENARAAVAAHLQLLSPEEDEAILRDAGFSQVSLFYTGFSFLKALNLPSSLYNMLPYIISLIVLAFTSKNSRAPKAEGIPYDKGMR